MIHDHEWLVPLLLVVSSILAIVANSLLLLVFFKRRGLRTISNRFVINLLVTNLLSSIVLIPLLVINENKNTDVNVANVTAELNISESVKNVFIGDNNKFMTVYKTKMIETEDFIEIDIIDINTRTGNFLCYFSQVITNLVCVSSIFGILLIGVDQYFAVIHPLRYHSYINKSKSLILLLSIWVFSIFISLLDLLVFDFSTFWKFCHMKTTENYKPLEVIYAYLYFFVIILIPFLTICLIYAKIYFAAHRSSERMRKSNSSTNSSYNQLIVKENEDNLSAKTCDVLPRIHSAPNITNLPITEPKKITRSVSDRTNANNIIISLKSKLSNASVFKYREETRAARISILVIFMVLVCYFPYGITIVANSYSYKQNYIFNFIAIVLLILSNIVSPFLFAYRNKRIQRELLKLLLPKFSLSRNSGKTNKTNGTNKIVEVPNESAPFLDQNNLAIPKVIVTLNTEQEGKKSILKRVCSKTWSYKKCNFISVPDSCLEARASFSSASTQMSSTEE